MGVHVGAVLDQMSAKPQSLGTRRPRSLERGFLSGEGAGSRKGGCPRGVPKKWPASASQRSDFDEDRCDRQQLMPQRRISATIGAGGTDAPPMPSLVRPVPADGPIAPTATGSEMLGTHGSPCAPLYAASHRIHLAAASFVPRERHEYSVVGA